MSRINLQKSDLLDCNELTLVFSFYFIADLYSVSFNLGPTGQGDQRRSSVSTRGQDEKRRPSVLNRTHEEQPRSSAGSRPGHEDQRRLSAVSARGQDEQRRSSVVNRTQEDQRRPSAGSRISYEEQTTRRRSEGKCYAHARNKGSLTSNKRALIGWHFILLFNYERGIAVLVFSR